MKFLPKNARQNFSTVPVRKLNMFLPENVGTGMGRESPLIHRQLQEKEER